MYLNDWALIAAILSELSIKESLKLYGINLPKSQNKNLELTEKQALHLKYLNKTMTWNELAQEFGINGEALRMQVYNTLKKATKEPPKVSEVAMRKNSISLYHTEGGIQVAQ